jgi:hypothetical protein
MLKNLYIVPSKDASFSHYIVKRQYLYIYRKLMNKSILTKNLNFNAYDVSQILTTILGNGPAGSVPTTKTIC